MVSNIYNIFENAAWAELSPKQIALRRMCLRDRAYNVARVHGVDNPLQVNWHCYDPYANGCTSDEPREIMLNPGLIKQIDPGFLETVIMGVTIHEAEHLLSSGALFSHMRREPHSKLTSYLLICDDARIEHMARLRSPGYAHYLRIKNDLTLGVRAAEIAEHWDDVNADGTDVMSVRSKAVSTILYTIKHPRCVPECMKTFEREGINPYLYCVTLRGQCNTWEGVRVAAKKLEELIKFFTTGKKGTIPEDVGCAISEATESNGDDVPNPTSTPLTSKEVERAAKEQDLEARARKLKMRGAKTRNEASAHMRWNIESRADSLATKNAGTIVKTNEKLGEFMVEIGPGTQLVALAFGDERGGKYTAMINMDAMAEEVAMEASKTKVSEDCWEWGGDREVVFMEPVVNLTYAHIQKVKRSTKNLIRRMKSRFSVRHGEIARTYYEQDEGDLDEERLAFAHDDRRLFTETYIDQAVGMSICLLLDESSSMGRAESVKAPARKALEMAYVMQEALVGLPQIDYHAYSHTSCGGSKGFGHRHCLIKRLYTPNRPDRNGIFGYISGWHNYDHVAIERVGKEFTANAAYDGKLMVILSDGDPAGVGYDGSSARNAVKKEIHKLERKGVQVLEIAIGAANPEEMFHNWLDLTSADELVTPICKFMSKIIKGGKREVIG